MKLILSSFVQSVIDEVHKELEHKKIEFRPKYYISDSWGCVNKIPVISIPYSFCYPIFKSFEKDNDGVIIDREPVLKIVRHEIGHAVNYAYKLYKFPRWKSAFGEFNKPYQIEEKAKHVNPFSKDYVVNLPDYNFCYAQLHPDEDFAETFAVWLSNNDWYLNFHYRVLDKLWCVDLLINTIRKKEPLVSNGKKHKPYTNLILKGR